MNRLLRVVVWLFVLFAITTIGTNNVSAQSTAGVGINPAIIDPADLFAAGESRQFSMTISNLSDTDQVYYLTLRDIVGVREGGAPVFAEDNGEVTGFELSDWIALSASELTIPARQSIEFPFVVSVPQEAVPGAHFGSVVISVEPPEQQESGAAIGYEVANIISIRVEGDVAEAARIRQFSTSQYIYGSTDVDFSVRVENEGNTLIKPTGPLTVTNMFGEEVASLIFNETKAAVFPKTARSEGVRDYELNWQDNAPGFGRYEAIVTLAYGTDGRYQSLSSTVSFWILPANIVVPALIVLVVVAIIITVSVKLYIRRSLMIATSGATRRIVRTRQRNDSPWLVIVVSFLATAALFFIVLLLLFA